MEGDVVASAVVVILWSEIPMTSWQRSHWLPRRPRVFSIQGAMDVPAHAKRCRASRHEVKSKGIAKGDDEVGMHGDAMVEVGQGREREQSP